MNFAVFAHYDKDDRIEPYVVYYLNELKKITNKIIFVSDSNLNQDELKKLDGIVTKTIVERHREYDFGSYKRGYLYLKDNNLLRNCNELVFVNDSCFGPLVSFQKIWSEMNHKTCDFWGITRYINDHTPLHIQSYFLVFKKQILNNEVFDKFMKSITRENNKMDVVYKYEIGLSQLLLSNGFKMQTLSCYSVESAWLSYLLYSSEIPFIKTMMIKNNFRWLTARILKKLWSINKTDYDINLILDYALKYSDHNVMRKIKNLKRNIIRFYNKSIYIFGKKRSTNRFT